MLLSEWYPLLKEFSQETRLLPINSNVDQAIQATLDEWKQVFVRLDERSPKYFHPCTTVDQVWACLQVARTKDLLKTSKYLCLRRWISFDNLIEIRCFLHHGLTAISQNDAQKDSEPLENPKECKAVVQEFICKIIDRLPAECTVDLALEGDQVQVVEVNSSFLDRAGEGLWDLDNPADRFQLEQGQGKVRFRYFVDLFYTIEEC